ncbi:MAG: zinc ribbon domain-containing protein [Terriglobia bacterium]
MHPEVRTVIELQRIDHKIAEMGSRIDALPARIQAIEHQLKDFLSAFESAKQRLAASQKERRELDAEIQQIHSKITKHRDQLYQVKTNEQYKAMLKEIEGEEGNIRKIEDRILERMVESEQLETQIKEASQKLDSEKARVAGESGDLEAERQAAIAERNQLTARRQELAESLTGEVLNLYDKLRKARHGIAVAEVRDGFCSGCHVRLRPQAYNDVSTSDGLFTCETCGRILYYDPPAEPVGESAGNFSGGSRHAVNRP